MHKAIAFLLVVLVSALLMPTTTFALAGIVYDPTNWVQNNATAIATAKTWTQSVRQTAAQLNMLTNLRKNSKNFSKGSWASTK